MTRNREHPKEGEDIVCPGVKASAGVIAHRVSVTNLPDKRPKRISFISIQNGHTIAAEGYCQPTLRTGYEYVMPYRVGKLYCVMAEEDGVVSNLTEQKIEVTYKSGKTIAHKLGSTYGRMEGSVYKHALVTELTKGAKFKAGDHITYNTGFFEKDWLDPSRLIMKFNKVVTVAFSQTDDVYEDSSAVSPELGEMMQSTVVKERAFIIEFDKNILDLKLPGQSVNTNDSLFTLVDSSTDYSNLSESSIDLLKGIANLSPKAKVNGTVYKIEVKYNGDYSDMSPTIKKLIHKLDKDIDEETKGTDSPLTSNRVTSEYRSEGRNLMPKSLELKIMLEFKSKLEVADKGVFGSQMKSVASDVIPGTVTTESGDKVDAMFSYTSVLNRIALSPVLMGTTNRILRHVSPKVADAYFG